VTRPRLAAIRASDLQRREPVMLRADLNAALGTVVVLCGQQGIGKGTITASIAAEVSHRHGVIFLAEEDSAEAVIKPRLEAAQADLDRVHIVRGERIEDGGALLPRDTDELAAIARATEARLLLIDPWTNHVDVPSLDRGQVRQALMPLARVANDCTLVAWLNAHPVKFHGERDPLSEIAHASAVNQIARSVFWVTLDPGYGPDAKTNPHRLLAQVKANLGPYGPTLRFELAATHLPQKGVEPAMTTVRAIHRGTSELTYAQIRKLERSEGRSDTALDKAQVWLERHLTEHGPTAKPLVTKAGEAAGHSMRTLERAAKAICDSIPDPPGPSAWHLRAGSPSGSPVLFVGEPGEPMEQSQTQPTPVRARPDGSSGSPTYAAGGGWRTASAESDDEPELVW
jgi:putative DNA primase/helicase